MAEGGNAMRLGTWFLALAKRRFFARKDRKLPPPADTFCVLPWTQLMGHYQVVADNIATRQ